MSLEKFVVISGLSGIQKMVGNRPNGLIVEELDSKKRKFVSARKHQFTPLDSISIYTTGGDTVPLAGVFKTMQEKLSEIPLPNNKMTKDEAFGYLRQILPNFDEDQVYFSDVKKLVKWFNFLDQRDMLDFSEKEEEKTEEEKTEK